MEQGAEGTPTPPTGGTSPSTAGAPPSAAGAKPASVGGRTFGDDLEGESEDGQTSSDDGMCDLERKRKANMARNDAFLRSLSREEEPERQTEPPLRLQSRRPSRPSRRLIRPPRGTQLRRSPRLQTAATQAPPLVLLLGEVQYDPRIAVLLPLPAINACCCVWLKIFPRARSSN